MRLLLTSHGYPPTVSGVTLVVQRVARAQAARGHEVTVLAASDRLEPYEAEDEGVRLIRLESHRNPWWPANPIPTLSLDELERIVHRVNPDAIHAHDALPFSLQLVRSHERLGVPIMATCHYFPSFVAAYLANGENVREAVESAAWRYTTGLYNRIPDVVFATYTHRDIFVAHGLTTRTHIISNGVDIGRYSPEVPPLDIAGGYGVPGGPRVLAVGRLAKDKDLEVLIRAIAAMPTEPPVQLVLVGEGPHRPALETVASETGVRERVHFLGFVPEEDLPGLYRACHVFAISSNHEVQSLPALQAAATALPIVAAAQGSLAEVCHDGENGILVQSNEPDAWAEALAGALAPRPRQAMGAAGVRLAMLHDEQRTFDAYEELYLALAARRTAHTPTPLAAAVR